MLSHSASRPAVMAAAVTRLVLPLATAGLLLCGCTGFLGGTAANSKPPYVPDEPQAQAPDTCPKQAQGSQGDCAKKASN